MKFHFLHIAKTGGTALNETLESFEDVVRLHSHGYTLEKMPPRGRALFVVREPVDRFVSGFNSRLRKGRPRHRLDWSPAEAIAFGRFTTPNSIAEALSSSNEEERAAAVAGMNGIFHSSRPLTYTLGHLPEFEAKRDRVSWIGHQPTLTADFEVLKRVLNLPPETSLPSDPDRAHVSPEGFEKTLSDTGRANLVDWYRDDYPVYRACLALREELLEKAAV